ncbi:MAG: FtsX-like permease family protein [Acidobacteriota bacterium]
MVFLSFVAAAVPASSAIGIANWLTKSPLPFEGSGHLRFLFSADPARSDFHDGISGAEFVQWASHEELGAFSTPRSMVLQQAEANEEALITFASANVIELSRIQVAAGRPPETVSETACTHGFAVRKFGSPAQALSQTLKLDGQIVAIVGVLEPAFDGLIGGKTDLLMGLSSARVFYPKGYFEDPELQWLIGLSRISEVFSETQLKQTLAGASARMAGVYPESHKTREIQIESPRSWFFGSDFDAALQLLFAAAALTSLAAAANLFGLMDSELLLRRGQNTVRVSLGAPTPSLVSPTLVPATLSGGVGLLIGCALGARLTQALVASSGVAPPSFSMHVLAPKASLMLFALCGTLGVAVLAGVKTYLAIAKISSMRDGALARSTRPPGKYRLVHVVGLVALSSALLSTSLLSLQSLRILARSSLGVPDSLVYLSLRLPVRLQGEAQSAALDTLLDVLRTKTDLAHPTLMGPAVAPNSYFATTVISSGRTEEDSRTPAYRHSVSRGFEQTLQLRAISQSVGSTRFEGSTGQALVSNSLAKRVWSGDAIGKEFRVAPKVGAIETWTVAGVLPDVLHRGRRILDANDVYFPLDQVPSETIYIVAAEHLSRSSYSQVRESVASWDPEAVLGPPETLEARISQEVSLERLLALVATTLAVLSFLQAAIATYGLIAADCQARAREWVIRRTLGLTSADVFSGIVKKAVLLSLVSAAVGIAFATGLGRALQDLLFGVTAADPFTALLVLLLVVGAGGLASLAPAVRAARTAPSQALKSE